MAKRARKKAFDLDLPIFQLRIMLDLIEPPIWRRVLVGDCDLADLHGILQIVMGWEDMHPHVFVIGGEEYGNLAYGGDFEYDSRSVRLSDVVRQGNACFHYDYDFGDEWRHIIEIETTLPVEEGARYPRCLEGERAGPPEDSGGPYGYSYLLEKLQDPQHEEHEEALEWVGQFDPEKFDLEAVNRQLLQLRRWLGKRRGRTTLSPAFAKGTLVRVKHGVVHDMYPDIPLGGWVGTIKRIGWLTPIGYAVHWTRPTFEQAPDVYFRRCRRDGLKPHRHWLEEDELEAAVDETPAAMEQPTKIITRPLASDDREDRIRMVFGLTSDDGLPKADEQTQRHYLDYLKARLSFPFKAEYVPVSVSRSDKISAVEIRGLAAPPIDSQDGIMCTGGKGKRGFEAPLALMRVDEDDPNFQYVEDYTYWQWESQDYEE